MVTDHEERKMLLLDSPSMWPDPWFARWLAIRNLFFESHHQNQIFADTAATSLCRIWKRAEDNQ